MKAFIEKADDGTIWMFLDTSENDVIGANGCGDTIEEAKKDLMEGVEFSKECLVEDGIEIPDYLLDTNYEYEWYKPEEEIDEKE